MKFFTVRDYDNKSLRTFCHRFCEPHHYRLDGGTSIAVYNLRLVEKILHNKITDTTLRNTSPMHKKWIKLWKGYAAILEELKDE